MVTPQHEALHRIFQQDSELFARTMRHVFHQNVPVPDKVSILDTDFTEIRPHVRRGDSVLLAELLVEESERRYIVVVESQQREDEEKERRWPYYIAYLHDKYKCPVVLVVVCNDKATAAWARTPIAIGLPSLPCMTVMAWVIGPDNLDIITDPEQAAADIGFAVLAAITHSQSGQINDILEALSEALDTIDENTASVLAELTEAGLGGTDGLPIWRALMTTQTYPYVSHLRSQGREEGRQEGREEGRQEGRQEGLAEGRAQAVVQVLEVRGIVVRDEDRDAILACRDEETLTTWLSRATMISDIRDLFRPAPPSSR